MKTTFLAAAAALALAVAPSFANASIIGISDISDLGATDTIDWGQLTGSFTTPNAPQAVTTTLGQAATVSSTGWMERRDQGYDWSGNFATGEHLLWSEQSGSEMTLNFLNPVSAVGAYIEANFYGPFVAEIIASNGDTLGSFALFGFSEYNPGTALFLGVKSTGADISQVKFHINGTSDFAIGTVSLNGSAVPEPATWAMMISGFAMAGMMLRSRRLVPVKA